MRIRHSIGFLTILLLISGQSLAQTATQESMQNNEMRTLHAPAMVDDTAITAQIKNKIASESSLSHSEITVMTNKGVVVLTGTVDTNEQANRVVEIAQATAGVHDVDTTHLAVKDSTQPMTDMFITAKVKGKFIQEKLFGDKDIAVMSISVETKDGVVFLTGTADTKEQADNAVKIAKSVSGVKKVESSVKVVEKVS